MENVFARQAMRYRNEMAQSCSALVGLAQGLLADGRLNDSEILFLRDWLDGSGTIASAWPGSAICTQVADILRDGVVTEEERQHLASTLTKLVGGILDEIATAPTINMLAMDEVDTVHFAGRRFCLTGDFAYATKGKCEALIEGLGGEVFSSVSKKTNYVIVGGLGSAEWKHGSYGTKIAKAMELKLTGIPLLVVHEDAWVRAIRV